MQYKMLYMQAAFVLKFVIFKPSLMTRINIQSHHWQYSYNYVCDMNQ